MGPQPMILLPQLTRQARLYRAPGGKDTAFLLTAAWVPTGGKETRRWLRDRRQVLPAEMSSAGALESGHCPEWRGWPLHCCLLRQFRAITHNPAGLPSRDPFQAERGTREMPGPTWLKERTNCCKLSSNRHTHTKMHTHMHCQAHRCAIVKIRPNGPLRTKQGRGQESEFSRIDI